jgi:hypothetical protein
VLLVEQLGLLFLSHQNQLLQLLLFQLELCLELQVLRFALHAAQEVRSRSLQSWLLDQARLPSACLSL